RRGGDGGLRADLPRGGRHHRARDGLSRAGPAHPGGGEAPGGAGQPLPAGAGGVRRPPAAGRHGPRAAGGARRVRLGRIPWINCYPVYGAVDRGIVPVEAEVVSGTASELNDLMAAGELQVSVVSAVEYARNAAAYHLLPDLAISCEGPVHSVVLFSRRPPAELDGATVLLSASSRTSVLLLQLLCRHRWGVAPRFATARTEAGDLASLAGLPHDAVLVIGDAALLLAAAGAYPVAVDLGRAWHEWTGLP